MWPRLCCVSSRERYIATPLAVTTGRQRDELRSSDNFSEKCRAVVTAISRKLGSVENVLTTFPILNIPLDGDFEYDYENRSTSDSLVLAYQCLHCGFELEDENGNTIHDCLDVIEWIKKHTSEKKDG